MIEQLIKSATFGFGASGGRDLYRLAKRHPIVFVLIAVSLVAVGWRGYYLGIGKGRGYKFFVTFLGSTAVIIAGTIGCLAVGVAFVTENSNASILIALVVILISTIVGNLWGLSARSARIKSIENGRHNQSFLEEIGLKDSAFEQDLLEDRDGNLLKLMEQTDEKIVFSVSGRRNQRAAIKLHDGRMVDYTGIVKV